MTSQIKRVRLKEVKLHVNHKMPKPIADNWNWQQDGLCRTQGQDLFFYDDMERGPEKDMKIEAAVAICNQCPVAKQCLDFAMSTDQNYGVWGGQTEEARAKLKKRKHYNP